MNPANRPYRWTAPGRRVIGVDGEGNDTPPSPALLAALDLAPDLETARNILNRSERHAYTMMAAADDTGRFKRHVEHDGSQRPGVHGVTQPNFGLPTAKCLDFLLDLRSDPSDLFVGFSFTYDAVKILSDLPLDNLRELSKYERTDWAGYHIEFRPRKYLSISEPRFGKMRYSNGKYGYVRGVKVWDGFGYFQTSFTDALENSKHLFTRAELKLLPMIKRMKAKRSNFAKMPAARILNYCYAEVRLLAKMIREIIVTTEAEPPEGLGLYPSSFYGSSAISRPWMTVNEVSKYRGDAGIPEDVILASYFGGRFELRGIGAAGRVVFGHHGDRLAYAADIRSAYPFQLTTLPCLACATSRRVTEYEPGKPGVYLVGSKTSGPWAPFPMRIPADVASADRKGFRADHPWLARFTKDQVVFAHGGKRWVWQDEVAIARKHFGAEAIPVYDGYVIDVHCDHQPFAGIKDLFAKRREIKAEIKRSRVYNPLEKVVKLLVNAIYGLTAQSIGHMPKRGITRAMIDERIDAAEAAGVEADLSDLVEPPEFTCYIWAAMTTSGTRAYIYDLIMRTNGAACSVATDGIISDEPLKPLFGDLEGDELGDLEFDEYRDLMLYQSGVYTYEYLDRGEYKTGMKSRGFSPKDITASMLREAWDSGLWDVMPKDDARAFTPMRLAVAQTRKGPLTVMGEWGRPKRPLSFLPSKRWPTIPLFGADRPAWIETEPRTVPDDALSVPYRPKQSWRDVATLEGWFGTEGEDTDLLFLHDDDLDEGND